jgi:hypothetical protein
MAKLTNPVFTIFMAAKTDLLNKIIRIPGISYIEGLELQIS